MLLVRRDWRPLAIGGAIATVVTALALTRVVSAAGSPSAFVASVEATYAARAHEPRKLELSPTRVDVVAGVARVLGRAPGNAATLALTVGVLGFAAAGLRRLARSGTRDARVHATNLACLAIVACAYHQQYDLLILALPLATLVWRRDAEPWRRAPRPRRLALALVALPLVNFVASDSGARLLELSPALRLALTSLDGVAVLALLAIFGSLALTRRRPQDA